jgi:hypothetical protein
MRAKTNWSERACELDAALEAGRNDTGYDCIVPSSGGKDSHWQVLKLIELGAKPLVVTATTCHLTGMGRKNIDNLSRHATTIEVTPNRDLRKRLNRQCLELVGDISWPEHVSIFTTPFKVACDLGIPLILYGECPQEAYGGPPGTEEAKEMTLRWVQEFGGFLGLRPSDFDEDMTDYMPPDAKKVEKVGVTARWLGQYYEWDSHRNAEVAVRHGMRVPDDPPTCANWWVAENLDNFQTGIHDYLMALKFGYGRATAQLSVDIRNGRIDRNEALKAAEARDGMYPLIYMGMRIDEILGRIDMTVAEFDAICEKYRCSHAA